MVSSGKPRGYWGVVIALAGLALTAAGPQHDGNTQAEATGTSQSQTERAPAVAPPTAKSAEVIKRTEKQEPCGTGQYNKRDDLCAQWKAADAASDAAWWSMWTLIVGVFGTIGLFINLHLTRQAVKVARDATNDADKALAMAEKGAQHTADMARNILAANRPRVFAASLHPSKDNIRNLRVILTNAGQTPAIIENIALVAFEAEERRAAAGEKSVGFFAVRPNDTLVTDGPVIELAGKVTWDDETTVRGKVTYFDVHGVRYESGFSFFVCDNEGVMAVNPDGVRERWYDRRVDE